MQHAFLVELADTPGALADVTEAIAAKGVNITSVSGTTCGQSARIAIATDDNAQTRGLIAVVSHLVAVEPANTGGK